MSITAANAVVVLTVPGIFDQGFQLQQFAADNVFGVEPIEAAETAMGVDGVLTGGFINVPTRQTFYLMGDSSANFFFDQWFAQQKALQDTFIASGTVNLKGISTKYSMVRGFLSSYQPISDVQRTIKERRHIVTWQSAIPNPSL
jgi:hypothetical protein